ncbi:MAG: DMT family transporter [Alphaproteobacteria bacterium]
MNKKTHHPLLAIGAIVCAVFGLSLGDALIKQTSADFSLWQLFVMRSVFAVPLLLGVVVFLIRRATIVPRQLFWATVRSLMLAAMWVAYYLSLSNIDFAVAAAAYYTIPIFIVLFAALFVKERVGRSGWLAVALGFGGVLLVLRPDAAGLSFYAVLPLASAMLYAGAMILTGTKCRTDHPLTLALALNIAFLIVGLIASAGLLLMPAGLAERLDLVYLLGPWTPLTADTWTAAAILSLAIICGSVGAAVAYQIGPASVVGVFDYSYLAFAALWGFLFFGETPDGLTALGMGLIFGAGALVALRR